MTADTIGWRSFQWSTEQLRTVRGEFAMSFEKNPSTVHLIVLRYCARRFVLSSKSNTLSRGAWKTFFVGG